MAEAMEVDVAHGGGRAAAFGGKGTVTGGGAPVVADVDNNSGQNIALHPLALLNVSDHYTRTKMQQQEKLQSQVIGALLGSQKGRDIDISNSYELLVTEEPSSGQITVDPGYFITKQEQCASLALQYSDIKNTEYLFKGPCRVFPELDFLGWYSTGTRPTQREIDVHRQMMHWNESPLYLQLNPSDTPVTTKSLPVTVYESIVDIVDGQAVTQFVRSKYKIDTSEAERIAVEHVAHARQDEGREASSLITHLTGQRNAIKMLQTRIRLLSDYVRDVDAGLLPRDHTILRQIGSLCNRLPTACKTEDFREEFLMEYSDVLLASYIAIMTKGTNDLNLLVDRVSVLQGGGMRRSAVQ
ncbi:MAG: maintenance of mitochondrial structure and function-domain-containing protein [Olpidium bornovanus]|uniref:COP9 signalosome complex subunit 6 n=1 Tax=Olpidium bornovanus TaxID=278681 RepID=A0A8H8A0H4_9FUNG|nr:MAG: maintenance of mitochondrial structure and function-domain-containing protein [Olpidium bornovanus]